MSAVKWAALPVIAAGLLTGEVAVAAADEPVPTATPTPALTPTSTPVPAATPTSTPDPPTSPIPTVTDATVVYLVTTTTTTTTTIVNAPITVVTAPITTTVNNSHPTAPALRLQRQVLDLSGCGQPDRGAQRANVRLARDALLVVRVNHRRVAALQLPSSGRHGVPLQLRVARNGMLTIRRPSGRVVSVQGCTPN
jgi:hypothetical protein